MSKKLSFAKIREKLETVPDEMAGREARIGWFPAAVYEDGTPVAYVATIHEYGAPERSIPKRPTIGPTVAAKKKTWAKLLGEGVNALLAGKTTGDEVLDKIGQSAVGDIKKTISELEGPALSPVTLMLRKMKDQNKDLTVTGQTVGEAAAKVKAGEDYGGVSTKPLVESGIMYNTVTNQVSEKE